MDKENIMLIEYTKSYSDSIKVEMVALYNQTRISQSDVKKLIKMDAYNVNVIHMEKQQYTSVFGEIKTL